MLPQTNSLLIRGLASGGSGQQMWQQFDDAYRAAILGWCKYQGLGQHDSEDILQNTMTKMFLNIHTYDRDKARFSGWLKTIVLNEIRDRFRRVGKSEVLRPFGGSANVQVLASHPDQETDDTTLDQESPVAEVFKAVKSRVKDDNWSMFVRSKFLGEGATSIAKEFGLKRASIYQNVSRITKMLKMECESAFGSSITQVFVDSESIVK